MKQRTLDEMITYFNQQVDQMDIDRKYKLQLLGMITAIGFEAQERKTDWIPCSERLPEENKEVLINLAWGIDIGEYREGGWHSEWINHYDDDNVIAWMPLPEPYQMEEKK